MPTEYDAKILQDYADDLYKQAHNIIVQTATKYGAIMFLLSAVGAIFLAAQFNAGGLGIVLLIVLTLLGVAVGLSEGRSKAFKLKLEAQQLLCQRQIEINTRPALGTVAA
jgi:uncharacterized membrane protein